MTGKGALSVEACGPNLLFGGGFGGKMCNSIAFLRLV